MSGLTASLGSFLADFRAPALPDDAVSIAKIGFVDLAVTMLAGAANEAVRIVENLCFSGDETSILLSARRASAR